MIQVVILYYTLSGKILQLIILYYTLSGTNIRIKNENTPEKGIIYNII